MGTFFHIPVDQPLNDMVQLFWQVNRENDHFRREVILPKGIIEIVFNFLPEITFSGKLYNKTFTMPKCFIQGYHDSTIELDLPGSQFLFGVVIHTAATKHILQVSAGEFARQCIDITLVDTSFSSLWDQLAAKQSFQDRVALFSDWLKKRSDCLSTREQNLNKLFSLRTDKHLSVPNLSQWLCYSSRHLARIFYELTGMNTEQTLLYLKYLKAIHLIHHADLSLTQVAYHCGFSDQSHFIKTFKSFTTLTPNEYRNKKSDIAGHYFEDVR
ncbi:MAG: AraC family transcriptional regulator [Bacteroidia bacterium]|nr:helix-turn-helix transcriptional regulator [Bacteroidia bacterium]MCZ2278390.1 AraC family transcriptional regulator [Bacteroidia bacterium]